jgi:hypothetical protein
MEMEMPNLEQKIEKLNEVIKDKEGRIVGLDKQYQEMNQKSKEAYDNAEMSRKAAHDKKAKAFDEDIKRMELEKEEVKERLDLEVKLAKEKIEELNEEIKKKGFELDNIKQRYEVIKGQIKDMLK